MPRHRENKTERRIPEFAPPDFGDWTEDDDDDEDEHDMAPMGVWTRDTVTSQ